MIECAAPVALIKMPGSDCQTRNPCASFQNQNQGFVLFCQRKEPFEALDKTDQQGKEKSEKNVPVRLKGRHLR